MLLLLAVVFSGCGQKSPSELILGRWIVENEEIESIGMKMGLEFLPEGEGTISMNDGALEMKIEWTISEQNLEIYSSLEDDTLLLNIDEISEERMVLSGEEEVLTLSKETK